eukprot:CAMPEP_0194131558 /NCGR_PEP_ID=MMETSP0152-20130528/2308_1 /TAXON_ID=1049557 /ORGANISM="Thalassiothrix antarctica, Strain L6-D1" /LENGTH=505 /DNA_ID=CAMNT_0038826383 /DNA_START=19 /DNA_END=1536 /DNA_ORIENTATION=-
MNASTGRIVRTAVNKRPITLLSTCGITSGISLLCYKEWNANNNKEHSLPRKYSREALHKYWLDRPITIGTRLATVLYELGPCFGRYIVDFKLLPVPADNNDRIHLEQEHAIRLRETLTTLGPAFIKAGQQLSIRPDLVPASVLKELQKLCDAVKPVPDEVALRILKKELKCENLDDIFDDLHLVASASLGQVYKATLKKEGHEVAIKVQRPNILQSFSLDLFLLQSLGYVLDSIFTTVTKQAAYHHALFDAFSRSSYLELDYENEAQNQIQFKIELAKRKCKVKVPSTYNQYTTQHVLTSEWINGTRLADAPKDQIKALISDGVELFLIQLLDFGRFHADPHPGNIYVTDDGILCLLDFGLCSDIDPKARSAMTKAIVHLLTGDFDSLIARDAKDLGFLPEDLDISELKPILKTILTKGLLESGSNLHNRKRKLMDISNELNDLFFRYPFSVPPFFALVTRGLGLLEGIALSGDPEFDIFRASLPYATKRAIDIMGSQSLRKITH